MNKEIPEKVIKKAQNLIDQYGQCIEYLGDYKNSEYYVFRFPDGTITGFPFVYVYFFQKDEVIEITGHDALEIIGVFKKQWINNKL